MQARIPGAFVQGVGTETSTTRAFTVTVIDTDQADGLCATVYWRANNSDGLPDPDIRYQVCGSTYTFTTQSVSSENITVLLCTAGIFEPDPASANGTCNHVYLPDLTTQPGARAAGTGFNWYYFNSRDAAGHDWAATLTLGAATLSYAGQDRPNAIIYIDGTLQIAGSTLQCAYGEEGSDLTVYNSELTLCTGPQSGHMPLAIPQGEPGTELCTWTPVLVRLGGPAPAPAVKSCIVGQFASPN